MLSNKLLQNLKALISISAILLISQQVAHSQFHRISWTDKESKIEDQIRTWPNGKLKTQNKSENGKLVRYQYFNDGAIQLKAEIVKKISTDTITIYDPETYEAVIEIEYHNIDRLEGKYEEYYQNNKLKAIGTRKDNIRIGQWREYWKNDKPKIERFYLTNGLPNGLSKEYYENGQLKEVGRYETKTFIVFAQCYDPDTYLEVECKNEQRMVVKAGKWKYYDKLGKKIKQQNWP
jgi:antitoxin component YwqK of YwqJK toxin-antitoxin module